MVEEAGLLTFSVLYIYDVQTYIFGAISVPVFNY